MITQVYHYQIHGAQCLDMDASWKLCRLALSKSDVRACVGVMSFLRGGCSCVACGRCVTGMYDGVAFTGSRDGVSKIVGSQVEHCVVK